MKIVKADAKGRVTGFEPGVKYRQESDNSGVTVITEVQPEIDNAPCKGVVNVYDLFSLMGFNAKAVSANEDIVVKKLTAPQREQAEAIEPSTWARGMGLYFRVYRLDEKENPIMTGDYEKDTELVCVALDITQP